MSTLTITVKSARTGTDLADRFGGSSSDPRRMGHKLFNYFTAVTAGLDPASVDVQTGAADPVAATGTLTLTYASIAANDTVTVAGVVLTAVTGAPSGAQFQKQTDGPTTATNLAALVNSNATTSKYVVATAAGSVVTLTALVKHATGNLVTLASSNGTGVAVSAATLTGGAGGATAAPTTYAFGL